MSVCQRLGLPGFENALYWRLVRDRAQELGSDGCSGPTIQVHVDACYEHDVHYWDHRTIGRRAVSRAQADAVLRERIQQGAPFRRWPPLAWLRWGGSWGMSWWRWAGVRIGGWWAYHDHDRGTPLAALALLVLFSLLAGCVAPQSLPPTTPSPFCDFRMVDHNRRACTEYGGLFLEPQETFPCGACLVPQRDAGIIP